MPKLEIKACGCYDGPWAPDDPDDVSVRCDEHAENPGFREGALRMTVLEARIASTVGIRRCLKKGLLKPPPRKVANG